MASNNIISWIIQVLEYIQRRPSPRRRVVSSSITTRVGGILLFQVPNGRWATTDVLRAFWNVKTALSPRELATQRTDDMCKKNTFGT